MSIRRFVCEVTWFTAIGAALAILFGWWEPSIRVIGSVAFIAIAGVYRHDLYRQGSLQ